MIEKGVNALDLIDSPQQVGSGTFTQAIAILQSNYGVEYAPEKVALLFDMVREDGWSEERFSKTLRWFLKNKPFPAWTMSDWFSYGVKVYPYAWYLEQVNKFGGAVNKQIQTFKLPDGTRVFKYRNDETLPFEEVL